jgi:hypothetical protein
MWSACTGAGLAPPEHVVRQVLEKYGPEVTERALTITGKALEGGFVERRNGAWVRYLLAVARTTSAGGVPVKAESDDRAPRPQTLQKLEQLGIDPLNYALIDLVTDKRYYVESVPWTAKVWPLRHDADGADWADWTIACIELGWLNYGRAQSQTVTTRTKSGFLAEQPLWSCYRILGRRNDDDAQFHDGLVSPTAGFVPQAGAQRPSGPRLRRCSGA